jgi:hypothetical protein
MGNGQTLEKAVFLLQKIGSPVGNLKAALYAITGTYGTNATPTGAAIETSTAVAMADVSAAALTQYTFTFAGMTTLTSGTYYFIVIYADSATTLNTSNYIRVGYAAAGAHSGNGSYFDSGTWKSSTNDVYFIVFYNNDGESLVVSATPDTANGYVCPTTNPFLLDGVNAGTTAADGESASITIPEQLGGTFHQLLLTNFIKGWGVISSGPTPAGYIGKASGATQAFTAVGAPDIGYHWHIYLDGGTDLGNSPATCPAQADGTYHTISQGQVPN